MQNNDYTGEEQKKKQYEIRPVPLWVMLICGLIITFIGIYLYVTHTIAGGHTLPGKGRGSSETVLTGTSTITIGVVICMFPVYHLIKNVSQRKTEDQNMNKTGPGSAL